MSPPVLQPMLAAKLSDRDLEGLRYPMLASPKIDGIRVLIHPDLGPVTRKLKPVRNAHVRARLTELPAGIDGEVVCGPPAHPEVMNRTTRGVMRADGRPEFTLMAFDWVGAGPFAERHARLVTSCALLTTAGLAGVVRVVRHEIVWGSGEVREYEAAQVAAGYEGIMLRDLWAPYKHGRSTLIEQGLLKLKRFEDAEAEVVGVKELHSNTNELERDERGYAKRSSRQAGRVPTGVLGALVCRSGEFADTFDVGTGFTAAERSRLWRDRRALVGRLIKFRYQPVGVIDAPRFPTFVGFRED